MLKDIMNTRWDSMFELGPKFVNSRFHVSEWDGSSLATNHDTISIIVYYNYFSGEPNCCLIKVKEDFDITSQISNIPDCWIISEGIDNEDGSKNYSIVREEIYEGYKD